MRLTLCRVLALTGAGSGKYNSVMLETKRILVMALSLAGLAVIVSGLLLLSACGQTGALYLPTEPAATHRATLPETLLPSLPKAPAEAPLPSDPANEP